MTQEEEAQLAQTVEMFEVIAQTQPFDYQSLEILKEAYSKLGREPDAINTSKRIAHAYVQMGQFSSAILEYETILQHQPDDPEVQAALKEIESKAKPAINPVLPIPPSGNPGKPAPTPSASPGSNPPPPWRMAASRCTRLFVDGRIIAPADFDLCWQTPELANSPADVIEPFIQIIADKGLIQIDAALKLLSDRTRLAFFPLEKYDLDMELARSFPADTCRRWSVLPFDRMSKSILVATANPFNQQAAKELAESTNNRLLWYLVPPLDLVKNLRKVFR